MPASEQRDDPITGLVVTMAGTPRAQPRPRFVGGRVVSTGTPKAKAYASALERAAREAVANLGGADAVRAAFASHGLALLIYWTFPTRVAQRWGSPHTMKPDSDNLEKLVCDCLARAGALGGDDARVADVTKSKVWGRAGSMRVGVGITAVTTSRPQHDALAVVPTWLKP